MVVGPCGRRTPRPLGVRAVHAAHFRPLSGSETALLEFATLGTTKWCGERITPDDVRTKPEYTHYTRLIAERGDFGVVAEIDGEVAGVAWAVFLTITDAGYGFVDEQTPELSLWASADHRRLGIGRKLLYALIAEATARSRAQISLSVEAGNHAKRKGSPRFRGAEADGVMLRRLP